MLRLHQALENTATSSRGSLFINADAKHIKTYYRTAVKLNDMKDKLLGAVVDKATSNAHPTSAQSRNWIGRSLACTKRLLDLKWTSPV